MLFGAASLTIMVIVVVALPPVLVAVMVYEPYAVIAVGVPEISPVLLSNVNPAGRAGDTVHVSTTPPE